MKFEVEFFHCGDQLEKTLAVEISEVEAIVAAVKWAGSFQHLENTTVYEHQTAYNKAFAVEFGRFGWEIQPILRIDPRFIGDF